jgi:hypothetical protein
MCFVRSVTALLPRQKLLSNKWCFLPCTASKEVTAYVSSSIEILQGRLNKASTGGFQ